jgi:hypothetical protein
MKVNSSRNETFDFDWLKDLSKNNPWVVFLVPIYILVVFFVLINPNSFSLNNLDAKYSQMALSLFAFTLLVILGVSSYRHGFHRNWSTIFLIYAITFLGLSLETLAIPFADMSNSLLFLIWRFPMVLFAVGLWINLAGLYSDKSILKYGPALGIIFLSSLWLIANLVILENISYAMNGFLFGVFIPITFATAFIMYRFGKETNYSGYSLIALSFLLIGLVYSQWTLWDPTSLNPLYSISFTILNLGLILLLRGFNSKSLKNRVQP